MLPTLLIGEFVSILLVLLKVSKAVCMGIFKFVWWRASEPYFLPSGSL
jgi:hypothetical protein